MENFSTWESVLLGAIVLLVIFWFRPGIKATWERSQNAESDWGSLLLPIGMVILFVVFLMSIV
jgi:hypothetical protein